MSVSQHIPLVDRYRPVGFDYVVGQKPVIKTLRNMLANDRFPPATLLTGPSGVGKTSLARIVAKALNCEKGSGDSPCLVCDTCRAIGRGDSMVVNEIDAASNNGVDEARRIRELAFTLGPGRNRVFIIDEVHMLTTAAFNALLKVLEEPPPTTKFILCTTNKEKIPGTILSRCVTHHLSNITALEIAEHLRNIVNWESEQGRPIDVDDAAIAVIASTADGNVRNSVKLLDKAVAFSEGKLDEAEVARVLSVAPRTRLLQLVQLCADTPAEALQLIQDLWREGQNLQDLCSMGAEEMFAVLRVKMGVDETKLRPVGEAEMNWLKYLADRLSEDQIAFLGELFIRYTHKVKTQGMALTQLGFLCIFMHEGLNSKEVADRVLAQQKAVL